MRRTRIFMMAAVVFISSIGLVSASDFTPRGGFMIGRIAAKRLKKMREKDNFSGADQNKDGKLDKEEIDSAKKEHDISIDDETFKKIDKDGDGMLSHEECEKYHGEMEKAEKDEEAAKSKKDVKSEDKSKE